jgi:hypothetical protein
MWMITIEGALIGLLISAVASSPEAALHIFPLALIPQLLLAGLFIPVNKPDPFYPKILREERRIEVEPLPEIIVPRPMGLVLRYGISPFMVGRWGLESLAELYTHDLYESPEKPYVYSILNSITISLHANEAQETRQYLAELNKALQAKRPVEEPSSKTPASALPWYVLILGLFMAVTAALTGWALKRKELHS